KDKTGRSIPRRVPSPCKRFGTRSHKVAKSRPLRPAGERGLAACCSMASMAAPQRLKSSRDAVWQLVHFPCGPATSVTTAVASSKSVNPCEDEATSSEKDRQPAPHPTKSNATKSAACTVLMLHRPAHRVGSHFERAEGPYQGTCMGSAG